MHSRECQGPYLKVVDLLVLSGLSPALIMHCLFVDNKHSGIAELVLPESCWRGGDFDGGILAAQGPSQGSAVGAEPSSPISGSSFASSCDLRDRRWARPVVAHPPPTIFSCFISPSPRRTHTHIDTNVFELAWGLCDCTCSDAVATRQVGATDIQTGGARSSRATESASSYCERR